ncbi:MAG: AAA family ATPase [Lachnospiraceae bacterium]
MEELSTLAEQNVNPALIEHIEEYRTKYPVAPEVQSRILKPSIPFFGKDILEMAIAGLLSGENLLLSGSKATGKNILAENLCYYFNRPTYNVSFHVNTNSADLIGTDTFKNNEVQLRRGSISRCAQYGGFGILDEINMAKNDAVSVLHATLDYRRTIDVPGYDKIDLHPAARFIATMNYGYAGTKELNEALVSRFLVIDMPPQSKETLQLVFRQQFPTIREEALEQFVSLFLDLQIKANNSEISTKTLDLRGLLAAAKIVQQGLKPLHAVKMGITNKSFDVFEREIVEDVVMTRIPENWTQEDVFAAL